jgi:hypothetical protein
MTPPRRHQQRQRHRGGQQGIQNISRVWQRGLYAAVLAVSVTGLACLLARYLWGTQSEFGPVLPNWFTTAAASHGAAAMLATAIIGVAIGAHSRAAARIARGRMQGYAVLTIFLVLLASGYGLYYLSEESQRAIVRILHWSTGLALGPLLAWHLLAVGRTARNKGA